MSGKYDDLIKKIEGLSVLELSELVKELEEKFGVSAAPMMMAGAAPAAAADAGAGAAEKTSFDVELKDAGSQKIQVIKVVRELTGKGLKEAKDIVDAAPQIVQANVAKAQAEETKKKLEEAGAVVVLK